MLPDWLILDLTQNQLYGLIFLIGSFTVATLSDLKYMKAQSEFVEVWVLALIVFLAIDIWRWDSLDQNQAIAKWILIFIFMPLAHHSFGILFKLARGDVFACAAVMALMSPALIIVFIIILKVADLLFRPILRGFGSHNAYPFMPVVMAGTLSILGIGFYLAG
ncbi:MAG: hypothetical protein KAS16_03270 [Thermoplasmata archaeon]|nr:hypothetical protein [Thermoplasmata archaeon]